MFLIHNSHEQANLLASALVQVHRVEGHWYTSFQQDLAHTLFLKLLDAEIDFSGHPGIEVETLAETLTQASERQELLELLIAFEMLCNPIPETLSRDIDHWANALNINSEILNLARELAHNAITQATTDFYRCNWIARVLECQASC